MDPVAHDITQLLDEFNHGDKAAFDRLIHKPQASSSCRTIRRNILLLFGTSIMPILIQKACDAPPKSAQRMRDTFQSA
jgi:hypothetical protein